MSESSRSPERAEQRRTSVGAGLNLGSNRNAGSNSEQELAPENPSVLDKNTQFVRKHEAGIFEGKDFRSKMPLYISGREFGPFVKCCANASFLMCPWAEDSKSTR
jgi:hypothetical protein